MSKKNIVKIMLDIVMTAILVLLYNSHVFSMAFHEIAGLIIAGMFVIHCLFNRKWITSVSSKFFGGKIALRARFGYIINFLLLVTFSLVIISGIMTSQILFSDIAAPKGSSWRYVHHFAAAISIILVGTHLGLHWNFIMGMFKKAIKIPHEAAKPLSVGLLMVSLAFGAYSIGTGSFITWLTDPFITESSHSSEQYTPEEYWNELNNENKLKNTGDSSDHSPKKNENKGGSALQSAGDDVSHPAGEKKMEEGSPTVIINTVATYLSILTVFATITYYLDKFLLRKRMQINGQ